MREARSGLRLLRFGGCGKFLYDRQRLGAVAAHVDAVGADGADDAGRVNHVGEAGRDEADELLGVVERGDGFVGIGDERHAHAERFAERALAFGAIGADADDNGAGLSELRVAFAERAYLVASAEREGAEVEEQDDRPVAAPIREPKGLTSIGQCREIRCFRANCKHLVTPYASPPGPLSTRGEGEYNSGRLR